MVSLVVEAPTVPLRTDEHGVLRVGDTRVRLDTVITAWKQGESPEQIVENFDVLDLADVYAVISYYLNHREEIERYLERTATRPIVFAPRWKNAFRKRVFGSASLPATR